jgi:hypothetical protein
MPNHSTTENANDAEVPRSGARPYVNATFDELETTGLTAADPIAGAGVDEHSSGLPAVGSTGTAGVQPPAATSTNSMTGHSQRSRTNQVIKVKCIEEPVRTSENNLSFWKPPFEVDKEFAGSLKEIIQRVEFVRAPSQATPVPNGTTAELFSRLQNAIAEQALLPEETSALLACWALSTWFSDGLSLAPGLVIVGPAHEGDLVLRTLRNFCHFSLMLTQADISSLRRVNWHTTPTLLFYAPHISKQMVTMLGCSATRGYMINDGTGYKDFYGPKAIYRGEEVFVDRIPRCSLQVRLQPNARAQATQYSLRQAEAMVQDMQNQLLRYRTKNLVRVYNSGFDSNGLTSDTGAIANALGACIIDSPELQSQLTSSLMPVEDQQKADRSSSLEAVTLEATLNLAHAGKAQILVNEVANEVNRIAQARGERLHYSAETVGHRLKKVGLLTRRLSKAGKGLVMDLATTTRAHERAAAYGVVGLDQEENNLHCPLCIENKQFM